jgi:hypothetical protein
MSEGGAWAVRLRWLGMLLLGLIALMFLTVCFARAQETKETGTQKPWTGKLKDGRVITQADLDQILQAHIQWLRSDGKEGQRADLSGADLFMANLSEVHLDKADLSKADLSRANLGAWLWEANLSKAILYRTNLSEAGLWKANLSEAIFEPKPGSVPDVSCLLHIIGLDSLHYIDSSHGLVELRETYKKAGMREDERRVTYALNHNRREKLWEKPGLLNQVESLFNLVCFEWTCGYGMNPGRPLEILGLGLFFFTPLYLLALRSRDRETGIWLVRPPDRILGQGSKVRPFKLSGHVGNWISRLQKNEYTLRATGWVRTVAGLQSLLSIYLLALWVLTYFGRPFD